MLEISNNISIPDHEIEFNAIRAQGSGGQKEGVIVIKAQQFRTQEKNREDALQRLQELIKSVAIVPRTRRPTKPTRGSQMRRLDSKKLQGQIKAGRGKVGDD